MPVVVNRRTGEIRDAHLFVAVLGGSSLSFACATWTEQFADWVEAHNAAFAFPDEVRRIVYTTNAIEALNAQLRRAVRARGHFPNDDAATKLLYLILNRSVTEWRMPPREWSMA